MGLRINLLFEVPKGPDNLRATERSNNSATLQWDLINDYIDANITKYQVGEEVSFTGIGKKKYFGFFKRPKVDPFKIFGDFK